MNKTEIIEQQLETITRLTDQLNKMTEIIQSQSDNMYETRNRVIKEVLNFAESLIGGTEDDLKKFVAAAKRRYYIS